MSSIAFETIGADEFSARIDRAKEFQLWARFDGGRGIYVKITKRDAIKILEAMRKKESMIKIDRFNGSTLYIG